LLINPWHILNPGRRSGKCHCRKYSFLMRRLRALQVSNYWDFEIKMPRQPGCSHGRNAHGEHGKEAVLFCVLRVLLSVAKAMIADQQTQLNSY
jgi:hypothetical protein